VTILTTKTVDFCVKWFHIMRRVKIKCFLTLGTPKKKNRYELWKMFLFQIDYEFYGDVFAFLEAMNWLDKVLRVFPRYFVLKMD